VPSSSRALCRARRRAVAWLALLAVLPGGARLAAEDLAAALARGDAAWERRAEGSAGGDAAPGPIGEAVAAYEAAVAAAPASLEARWKLVRALWFAGDYATRDGEAKKTVLARGRDASEQALELLAGPLGGRAKLDDLEPPAAARALAGVPEAAPVLYWSAVLWGVWGEAYGRMAAARQGVAGKIRWRAEIVETLDPAFERGGAARVLGRLHARAPRFPFVTGWIDRDFAIAELRKAVALAPGDTFNRLYLAEALAEHRPAAVAERRQQLDVLAGMTPAPERLVEDRRNLAAAAQLASGSKR
jgi:hypothetical protein